MKIIHRFIKNILPSIFFIIFSCNAYCQQLQDTTIYYQGDSSYFIDNEYSDTSTLVFNWLTFTQQQDSVFANLNKSLIPKGILYNRVYPFAEIDSLQENDTINTEYFIQALSEIERADYHFIDSDIFTPHYTAVFSDTTVTSDTLNAFDTLWNYHAMRNFILGKNLSNILPVMGFNYCYSVIDTNAIIDGRLKCINGLYYDSAGMGSPYLLDSTAFAVLGILQRLDSGKQYTLEYFPFYEFGNNLNKIASISIYNESNSQTYTLSQNISQQSITFNSTGNIYLDVQVKFVNGLIRSFKQGFKITRPPLGTTICAGPPTAIQVDIPYVGMLERPGSESIKGYGFYQIFYSEQFGCNKVLRKPILITDGFDAGDKTKIPDIYNYLNYNGTANNLGDDLRYLGYDVVILNFPMYIGGTIYLKAGSSYVAMPGIVDGGVDYIQRNAFVTIKLIQTLNDQLVKSGSSEKLVVVGPSMGGLVTRYALKYMENHGLNHNTRLWISFDSPHWGANIPYGFQKLLWYCEIQGNSSADNFYYHWLRSKAAQQLLIHQTVDPKTFTSSGVRVPSTGYPAANENALNNNSPVRKAWMNEINSLGYPNNLRKIALSNGTYSGTTIQTPGAAMFQLNADTRKTGIRVLMATPFFMNNVVAPLVKIWQFGSGTVYSPSDKTSLIYGPLDGYPGSTRDVQQEFATSAKGTTTDTVLFFRIHVNTQVNLSTHNICFIPTVSSLGLYNPNFDWSTPLDRNSILCNNGSPFDDIYMPSASQPHITLTQDNVNWLLNELNTGCPTICANVTGDNTICIGVVKTYTLSGAIPGSVSVNWSVGSGLTILSRTATSVTVRAITNAISFVKATITDNICGFVYNENYPVTVGIPTPSFTLSKIPLFSCLVIATSPTVPGTDYIWTNTEGVTNPPITSRTSAILTNSPSHTVSLQYHNSCGYSSVLTQPSVVGSGSGCGGKYNDTNNVSSESPDVKNILYVYPNPSSEGWNISINLKVPSNFQLLLYDITGRLIKTFDAEPSSNRIFIDNSHLADGIYSLELNLR